jgi:hypothetical protein
MLETPLLPSTVEILHESHAFYADTLFAHRNFSHWQHVLSTDSTNRTRPPSTGVHCCTHSRHLHNSHVVVLQRRDEPQRPYHPHTGTGVAPMKGHWIRRWRQGRYTEE